MPEFPLSGQRAKFDIDQHLRFKPDLLRSVCWGGVRTNLFSLQPIGNRLYVILQSTEFPVAAKLAVRSYVCQLRAQQRKQGD